MLCIYGMWMRHNIGRIDREIDGMAAGDLVELRVKI